MTDTTITTMTDMTTCAACGTTTTGTPPLDWVRDIDTTTLDRRVRYYCAECTRANLQSIEAGLASADW